MPKESEGSNYVTSWGTVFQEEGKADANGLKTEASLTCQGKTRRAVWLGWSEKKIELLNIMLE